MEAVMTSLEANTSSPRTISELNTSTFLPEGTVLLSRYMLMRVIAQGGSSFVYRARDMLAVLGGEEVQSHIAVKVVRNDDNENNQLALHEALTTRHLAHPNILKVFDYHRDGDISFVIMELIDGESLAQYIQRLPNKKLPYKFAISILQSVAAALQAAHDQGVVHSDIKPSNILKTENGEIKVIDFATARSLIEQKKVVSAVNDLEKHTYFYGYTLAYASPEAIADLPASASDDVFSYSCITYEVLAGKHPYGRKPTNTIDQDFRLIKPQEVNFWQWLVLKKGLELKRENRIKKISTFITLFKHARYFWLYLAFSVCFLIAGAILAIWGVKEYKNDYASSVLYEEAYKHQKRFQSVLDYFNTLQPIEQFARIDDLNEFTAQQKASGLALFRQGIIEAIAVDVQGKIELLEPSQAASQFSELKSIVERAQDIYPDSQKLALAEQSLNVELMQLKNTSEFALRQAWSNTDFSKQSINDIKTAIDLYQKSNAGRKILLPDNSLFEIYQNLVLQAVEHLDFINVHQLFEFSVSFESIDKFRNVWRAIDKGYVIGAQELVNYVVSASASNQYSLLASQFYIDPYFNRLDERVEKVWTDVDMALLKDQLFEGIDKYSLEKSNPVVVKVRNNLINKVRNKMKYYRGKSNNKGISDLNRLLREIG